MGELIGRLHPLMVHLPIGMVIFAVILEWWAAYNPKIRSILPTLWLATAGAGAFAALTGWLLGGSGEFDPVLLVRHRNAGLAMTAGCAIMWLLQASGWVRTVGTMVVITALVTTWMGAVITHGEGLLRPTPAAAAIIEDTGNVPATDIPSEPVEPADAAVIRALQGKNVVVVPVATGSNYLAANFINASTFADSNAVLLQKIAPQLVWIRLSGANLSDTAMQVVGTLSHLTRLSLEGLRVTDQGLAPLRKLNKLQTLNLTGLPVTVQGVQTLAGMQALKKIFLYKTAVKASDWPALQQAFPKVTLDSGGYALPFRADDTVRLKAPEKKK
jgi:uncharacterized membrane protein